MNLSVNLNKISLLRNARGGEQPDIAWFAQKALEKDIIGLTVHPRPCLLYTSPSPRDATLSRMPSSA